MIGSCISRSGILSESSHANQVPMRWVVARTGKKLEHTRDLEAGGMGMPDASISILFKHVVVCPWRVECHLKRYPV